VSALATVARVAALREKSARAAVAAANHQLNDAVDVAVEALQHAADEIPGVSLELAHQLGLLRAGGALQATAAVDDAERGRLAALEQWQRASARATQLDDVLARHLEEAALAREAAVQRELDDRSPRRSLSDDAPWEAGA
jgi:hypothetical protein